ncbi:GNAT family N-acetyltransferase [Flavobacterium sp.]|jgi:RimJ/RimL family protein N-acetyltransferase|uniref:GNAT family N-acetyltransferase n=1 Tax=Flavobacterium sp. TaxID=239 RepID=UPI0037BF012C
MKFNPIKVKLKNSKEVTIRSAEISDGNKLLNTIKEYIGNSDFIPKLTEEFKLTLNQEEDWINSFIQKDNSLLLVAEFEDNIIGNIDITGNSRITMQHTAVIGMGMLIEWRNSGLGTELMKYSIEWAKENPILELLLLQVYTENELGLNLYRKMEFIENGVIKNYFKQNGRYYDNLTMSLSVK